MDSMNKPLTIEKALELNVQKYAALPANEREKTLIWVSNAANLSPYKNDREFNAALLPLLFEFDAKLKQAQKPPLPTPAETNAFLLWGFGLLAKIAGGLVVIGGGLYLVGAFIYGTGNAFMAGALANSEVIFYGVCGMVGLVVAVAAYRNWPKNEETPGGETPVQNQTIINVYSATGGDVKINEK